MLQRALDIGNMPRLVAAMLKQGRAYGPVNTAQGVALGELSSTSTVVLDYTNFKLPVKRRFFPQCEVIGRYDESGMREEPVAPAASVIFGVRPCDARSLALLDKVFGGERFVDPYYRTRRDAALIITLACDTPGAACFCSSTGGGPADTAGADVVAFDLGSSLMLQSCSKRGDAFVMDNARILREPTHEETQRKDRRESDALNGLARVPVADAPKALAGGDDPALWDGIAESCLSCGACTFLCPTCHCFGLYDENQGAAGARLRVHDACMFAAFVREASGHNPRTKPGERMRQRVMHKFSYAAENQGEVFCVGCGRCVVSCPRNIDIRETVVKVTT